MTTAIMAGEIGTSLLGAMNAAEIGSVPVDVLDGHRVRFAVAGAEQESLDPLVRSETTDRDIESIPGYLDSVGRGFSSPSVELHRGWLEAGAFFRDWSSLQEKANWVAGLDEGAVGAAIQRTTKDEFLLGLLYDRAGNRGMARTRYEEAARANYSAGEYTKAALMWERVVVRCGPCDREECRSGFMRSTALSFLDSVGAFDMEYDPHSLRLAHAVYYAYGSGDSRLYRDVIARWAVYDGRVSSPVDIGNAKLCVALAILDGGAVNPEELSVAYRLIGSAAILYNAVEDTRMNPDALRRIAVEMAKLVG